MSLRRQGRIKIDPSNPPPGGFCCLFTIKVDLGKPYRLRFIATQGLHSKTIDSGWVQEYILDFRGDFSTWLPYVEDKSVKVSQSSR